MMPTSNTIRRYLIELVVVFVGVALAFAVENLREDLNEQAVGEEYLAGFRADLLADLEMLQAQKEARRDQLQNALVVLEFFEGRAIDPQQFFESYYPAMYQLYTVPNRNTMDEVLSSGGLRLIRDVEVRSRLLDLYVTYMRIAKLEEHMVRDFEMYLYDPTFSSIRINAFGPWEDTPQNRRAVEALLEDIRIENGFRLIVVNLEIQGTGLLDELELVRSQVEELLQMISRE
jgi:hypothetical protein